MRLRTTSQGRGTGYSWRRGVLESLLRVVYKGGWPAALWERVPGSCRVRCVRHSLSILPAGAPTLRIGFISDIHLGPTTPRRLLVAAFDQLACESLDVLMLGGDYVFLDADEANAELLTSLIRRVPVPKDRKFAVLGNHDLWAEHWIIERALRRADVNVLCNESVALEPAIGVAVVGLDDPWTGALDAVVATRDIENPRTVVFLCHSPDGFLDAARVAGDLPHTPKGLYLCGHTHGGHIATPYGPIVVPGRLGRRYPHGLHYVNNLYLHVSRGVGGIELPIRTCASPEVAVFELVARDCEATKI